MPRTNRFLTVAEFMSCSASLGSVAGEAEEVAGIMHPLMDTLTRDHRGGTLLGADEVQQDQHQNAEEDRPRSDVPERQLGGKNRGRGGRLGDMLRHGRASSGSSRPISVMHRTKATGLTRDAPLSGLTVHSGATVPDFHRLPCRLRRYR